MTPCCYFQCSGATEIALFCQQISNIYRLQQSTIPPHRQRSVCGGTSYSYCWNKMRIFKLPYKAALTKAKQPTESKYLFIWVYLLYVCIDVLYSIERC